MTITVQQFACQDTDLQQQEVREVSRQAQMEVDRYLSLKQNYGTRAALLKAIETLEAYEEAISDLNCFDDEQRATRKDAVCAMDELLDMIGDTLVSARVRN